MGFISIHAEAASGYDSAHGRRRYFRRRIFFTTIILLSNPIHAYADEKPLTYDVKTLPDTFITQTRPATTAPCTTIPLEPHQKRQNFISKIVSSIEDRVSSIIGGYTSSIVSRIQDPDFAPYTLPTQAPTTTAGNNDGFGIFPDPTTSDHSHVPENTAPGGQNTDKKSGLPTAAIIGIGVGIGVPVLIVALWLGYRFGVKRAAKRQSTLDSGSPVSTGMVKTPNVHATPVNNMNIQDIGINGLMPGIMDEGEGNVGGVQSGSRWGRRGP